MLLGDDRSVIARECQVPGLELVLDPVAVAALVADATGGEVRPLGATHARYKPGTNCVVGHRLSCDGTEVWCAAKAFRPDDRGKLDKAVLKSVPEPGSAWGVIVSSAASVVVSTLVNDRDLPALERLADPSEGANLIGRLLDPDRGSDASGPRCLRTVRHKPERRWVGTVEVDGRPTFRIKAYRPVDVKRAHAGHAALGVGPAAPVGWSRRRALIAGRWIHGTSLADLLRGDDDACLDAVGSRLAALHLRPIDDRLQVLRRAEVRRAVRTAADAISALDVDLARPASKVARQAARTIADGTHLTMIHGDFSTDQVIGSRGDIELIDFDEARIGDPIIDLASFGADLVYADLDGRLGLRAGHVFDTFVAGYQRAGGPADPDHLGPHLAAALLRRAVEPFRDRRADWSATSRGLVGAAANALEDRVDAT